MRITVFGGSAPKPGEKAYEEAYKLGRLIGSDGHTVLTGGYIGAMEAVSRGVAEGGGHVIGVTCDEIESWRLVSPNKWVQEEVRFTTVRERMFTLIEDCDVAFALPGGIGTLAEIAVMWNQMQTNALSSRPFILIGEGWKFTFTRFFVSLPEYIPNIHRKILTFSPDAKSAYDQFKTMVNV